ncbi:hypothetical protein EVAR_97440_1 [Eumeta japonica]|uniref:Uncharacterized protein n=1 Tax=Eumeta variegata TaxID=151549 RepID=A0A4C1X0Y1_EUMVA|nr:hypothetical protein EVAR_97440_1 [Eumeta japonica]
MEDKKEIEEQVGKLLENKLIEESYSPFAAPVTLAFKKEDNKKTRLCIDFRELNKIVVPQAQPFPLIDDLVIKTKNYHKPLENMHIKSRTDEELGELMYYMSQYDFKIKYALGKENLEADCFSRNPVLDVNHDIDEQLKIIDGSSVCLHAIFYDPIFSRYLHHRAARAVNMMNGRDGEREHFAKYLLYVRLENAIEAGRFLREAAARAQIEISRTVIKRQKAYIERGQICDGRAPLSAARRLFITDAC